MSEQGTRSTSDEGPAWTTKVWESFTGNLISKASTLIVGALIALFTPIADDVRAWLWETSPYPNGFFAIALLIVAAHAVLGLTMIWRRVRSGMKTEAPQNDRDAFRRMTVKNGIWSWKKFSNAPKRPGNHLRFYAHCPLDETELDPEASSQVRTGDARSLRNSVCPLCGTAYAFNVDAGAILLRFYNGLISGDGWRKNMATFDAERDRIRAAVTAHKSETGQASRPFDLGV